MSFSSSQVGNSHSFHKNAILSTFLKHNYWCSPKNSFCCPDSTSLYCYPVLTMILFILTLMDTFVVIQICWQSSIWWVVLVPKWDSQKKEVPPPLKCCRVRSHTITKVSRRARGEWGSKMLFLTNVVNETHSNSRLQEDQKWNLTHLTKICCHSKHTTLDKYYPNSKHMRCLRYFEFAS